MERHRLDDSIAGLEQNVTSDDILRGKDDFPRQIFLFSGKRKCGKDFLSNIFQGNSAL